jgi:hypothetical protein
MIIAGLLFSLIFDRQFNVNTMKQTQDKKKQLK